MDNIQKLKTIYRSHALRAVVKWVKPVHGSILLLSLLGVIISLLALAVTLVTKRLIDGATQADILALWKYGAMLAGLILGERLLALWGAAIRTRSAVVLQKHLQAMVTGSILDKEYASLKGFHSGELVNRVFSDVSVIKDGVLSIFPALLRTAVSFVGAAVILVLMDWRFIPVLIVASLIGTLLTLLFREPMKSRHKRMQAAEDALHASTQETLENIRVVKASGSEERVIGDIEERRELLAQEQLRNGRLSIVMNQGVGAMFDLSWLICNLWGCIKIYQGTFTYGSLAALIQLVGRIQAPISNAISMVSEIYGVVASAERLIELLGLPDEENGEKLEDFDEIRFENLSFQYADSVEDVLIDVNGSIQKGDFVALTGISGGGKTSLFQLLLGIYKPTSGRIFFQVGERQIPACRGTRTLFAYVPQGNMLFSGTLRDNLTMFTDNASEEEIGKALKAACLEELVDEIGLDAILGERGVGLSEGQSQRVAVARALLSGAPILLLDESTSALDEETEAKLLENISAMRDKTCIIVTHRRAALSICDYTMHIAGGHLMRIERTAL